MPTLRRLYIFNHFRCRPHFPVAHPNWSRSWWRKARRRSKRELIDIAGLLAGSLEDAAYLMETLKNAIAMVGTAIYEHGTRMRQVQNRCFRYPFFYLAASFTRFPPHQYNDPQCRQQTKQIAEVRQRVLCLR